MTQNHNSSSTASILSTNSNIISSSIPTTTKEEFGEQLSANLAAHGPDDTSTSAVYPIAADHQ